MTPGAVMREQVSKFKKRRSGTQAQMIDGARPGRSSKGGSSLRTRGRCERTDGENQKYFALRCVFSLHAEATLVFCECELVLPQQRERVSLRRTRVKIEFHLASRPTTFPRNPNSKEKSRQIDALAACSRHLLYGVWRHLRDGGDHSRRGLRPRDSDIALSAGAVVPADGIHDRRALQRAAAGRWLLRVGAPRIGEFLGLPGSVALAGRKHL